MSVPLLTPIIGAIEAGITALAPIASVVAPVAQIGGTVLRARATQASAEAANQAAKYNARILEKNVEVSDAAAEEALKLGTREENITRAQGRRLKGEQRAAISTSGALVDSGSTADVLASTERLTDVDALTIRENALKRAKGFTRQGTSFAQQADLSRFGIVDPSAAVSSTLLTGTGRLATRFSKGRS